MSVKQLKNETTEGSEKKVFRKTEQWVFHHWRAYTIIKGLLFSLWLPIPVLLGFLFNYTLDVTSLTILFVALFCFIPLFFFLDRQRVRIAKENASIYLRVEKVEKRFILQELILLPIWITSLSIFLWIATSKIIDTPWTIAFFIGTGIFSIFVIYSSLGFILYLSLFLFETPHYFRGVLRGIKLFQEDFVPKKDEYICFPSELEQANARFIVLSDFLDRNPSKKEVNGTFHLFRDGLELYNSYLNTHYGFIICNTDHFYSSSKLALHSASNEDAVKKGLKEITQKMSEHKEPFEIVRTLKQMIKEPATYKELCTGLEVEPKKLRKWFANQKNLLALIVILLSVVTAISQFMTNPAFENSLNSVIQIIQNIISAF